MLQRTAELPLRIIPHRLDGRIDALSDYLALSISRDDTAARINVTTTDADPTTYSSVFSGIQEIDLQILLANLEADLVQG